ncbi:hypothetical protein VNO78_27515 [Psophocarpus tetragonolobus]|uniref:UBZ4-type domain-containing protein n=1 Tax=Psophocarpus tetragonolobus TaxID=3891 RepID=A0AAN9XAQ1_PSOTE
MIRCGRDYTSKMRSVDVFKCWPFAADGVSRQEAESCLPPMIFPNSRRSTGELAGLRSNHGGAGGDDDRLNPPNQAVSDEGESVKEDDKLGRCAASVEEEKIEMICPVCRDFNAATLTAVNAHIDGCLARTVREEQRRLRRSKSKTQKKRSIAEIFELKEDMEEEKQSPEIEPVMKFLPFDGSEVSITVTKFRWLSERLEALRSNGISFESVKSVGGNSNSAEEEEKLEMLCPVCRVFNAATVKAAYAHMDGCLATAMKEERWRKRNFNDPKPKAPKKRSLADILTIAPQIDASGDGKLAAEAEKDDEGKANGEPFQKYGFSSSIIKKKCTNNNLTKKKRVRKVIMMRKKNTAEKRGVVSLNAESKKINKRKKRKKLNNEFTGKKGASYKRKMQNPVYSFRKLGTIGNKKVKLVASASHEKKLGIKILSEEKKEKVKNWDSVGKQQKEVFPIHGILKSHKHISGGTSSGSNIQDGTEESHSDVQVPSSDRHVGFCAEDYVLRPKKRNSFDETVFNLSSDTLASSSGMEPSSGNVEGTMNLEENSIDNIATNTDKRKKVCPMLESAQFSNALGHVAVQSLLKPCTSEEKSKQIVDTSESLSNVTICDNNLHRFDRGSTATMHVSPHGHVPISLSAFQGGSTSGINTQACESEAFSYAEKFIDHLGDPSFQSTNANTWTYLEPSSYYSASCIEVNERPELPFHTYGKTDNNGQALDGRSLSGTFSAAMTDNLLLLPGWGKGSITNNCMEQNFYGLPLNSHGELINCCLNGKVGMNKLDTACTLRCSLSGFPVNNLLHQNSQEHLSIDKRHVVPKTLQCQVNSCSHYSGMLGVRELHGREREDIYQHNSDWWSNHYVKPLDSELNLMRNSFIEQNQHDKVRNQKEYGIVTPRGSSGLASPCSSQPTMRLMGKDVPIGRSSYENQQFLGGVLRADEESRRHYSVDAATENSLLGRCRMPDRTFGSQLQRQTENVLESVKIQSNQALQSTLLMKGPNSEFLSLQSNHISENGSPGVSRNASSNFHAIPKSPTSCAIYNRSREDLPDQFISGAKPQGFCFHSQVPSSPCNFNNSTLRNVELNDWKKHDDVLNSSFGFPFSHPIVEEQAKSSRLKRYYRSLPPWSLGSTYERHPGSSSSTSFPQNSWRNDSTIPSVNHSADVLYPPKSDTSPCPRNAHFCATSSAHPHSPHASVSPIMKPPSAINSGCRNVFKVADRVKFDDMRANDHHPCTNSMKRSAADLVNTSKTSKLEMQKNFTRMSGLVQQTSRANLQQNKIAVELDLQMGARSKCCQHEAQNLNTRSYLGFDSSNQDGVVISDPVKLSPGARHILKPSLNQDNSIPIHSAIPVATTVDCGRDLELKGKLTKMYIF